MRIKSLNKHSYFEGEEEKERFDGVEAAVDKIPKE